MYNNINKNKNISSTFDIRYSEMTRHLEKILKRKLRKKFKESHFESVVHYTYVVVY